MEKRRSRGVTIIGRIIVVFAYLSLLKAIYALGMILFYKQGSKAGYLVSFYPNLFPYGIDEINGAKEFNKIFSVFISIMFTSSILLLSSGIGILKLKDWGRKLLLISYPSTLFHTYDLK